MPGEKDSAREELARRTLNAISGGLTVVFIAIALFLFILAYTAFSTGSVVAGLFLTGFGAIFAFIPFASRKKKGRYRYHHQAVIKIHPIRPQRRNPMTSKVLHADVQIAIVEAVGNILGEGQPPPSDEILLKRVKNIIMAFCEGLEEGTTKAYNMGTQQ